MRKTGIPVAATIMGKSVFPESDPAYIGVYEGAMGRENVRDYVEASDCIMLLGAMMTDMNLGIYTAHIDRRFAIYAAKDRVGVGLHAYDDVLMEDFIARLASRSWQRRVFDAYEHPEHPGPYTATNKPMTVAALFRQINAFLQRRHGGDRRHRRRALRRGRSLHPRRRAFPRRRLLLLARVSRCPRRSAFRSLSRSSVRWCWSATAPSR